MCIREAAVHEIDNLIGKKISHDFAGYVLFEKMPLCMKKEAQNLSTYSPPHKLKTTH